MTAHPAFRFAYSQCAIIAALLLCSAARLDPMVTLAAVAAVTVLSAARLPESLATFLGLVAWAFFTGFVVNAYGALTFSTLDLVRLTFLVGLAATAHWTR